MSIYAVLAVIVSLMAAASGMMKVRRDAHSTRIIHDVVGVPLEFFPALAACEFAAALHGRDMLARARPERVARRRVAAHRARLRPALVVTTTANR